MESDNGWTVVCYKKKKTSKKYAQEKAMNIISQPFEEDDDDYLPVPSCYKCKTNVALGY